MLFLVPRIQYHVFHPIRGCFSCRINISLVFCRNAVVSIVPKHAVLALGTISTLIHFSKSPICFLASIMALLTFDDIINQVSYQRVGGFPEQQNLLFNMVRKFHRLTTDHPYYERDSMPHIVISYSARYLIMQMVIIYLKIIPLCLTIIYCE